MSKQWTVRYQGFLQTVERSFPSKQRAEQWARQCGVYKIATIRQEG